jgi:hypothetical protein
MLEPGEDVGRPLWVGALGATLGTVRVGGMEEYSGEEIDEEAGRTSGRETEEVT